MIETLRFIFWDQLSWNLSTLQNVDPSKDLILFCETQEEATRIPHHPKKIAFLFSAMRHFTEELKSKGMVVKYVAFDAPENTGAIDSEILRVAQSVQPQRVVITQPGEWRLWHLLQALEQRLSPPMVIQEDERFLCTSSEFKEWIKGKKHLRMEYFYRKMRQKYYLLLDHKGQPVGGRWNYDSENRRSPLPHMRFPKRISHPKDQITREVYP